MLIVGSERGEYPPALPPIVVLLSISPGIVRSSPKIAIVSL
jgi:hypothetical protein